MHRTRAVTAGGRSTRLGQPVHWMNRSKYTIARAGAGSVILDFPPLPEPYPDAVED
ncbi:hypothetical protein [Actinoplanes xinjiangensis]|uniref:hypothetical protein n=1 Tax=Actinoplanes xinjiangensis TaxID=512350 RepID=UPI003413309E